MNRPAPPKLFWNRFACSRSMKRDHRKRNWPPFGHFTVYLFEILWSREETRIIVSNTEIHGSCASLKKIFVGARTAQRLPDTGRIGTPSVFLRSKEFSRFSPTNFFAQTGGNFH